MINLKLGTIVLLFFLWSHVGSQASAMAWTHQAQQLPADTIIRLERSDCFYICPAYVVTISADGSVTFEGKANVRVLGKAQTQIAVEKVRELVTTFLKISVFH